MRCSIRGSGTEEAAMQQRVKRALSLAAAAGEGAPRRGGFGRRMLAVLGATTANRGARFGLILVLVLIVAAIFAPWIAPYGPDQMGAGMSLMPPSADHWFGTDEFGRDMFSRVVYGARLTIQVGVIAVGISLTVGTLMGLVAGYARGWTERVL